MGSKLARVLIAAISFSVSALFFLFLLPSTSQKNQRTNFISDHLIENKSVPDWNEPFDPELLTGEQILEYFHWSNGSTCRLVNYFGGSAALLALDGQKAVCFDPEVKLVWQRCLVYSFGINQEWSFEDQMAGFGCKVYAFDPSTNETDHDRGDMIHFYHIGLSNIDEITDNGWNLHSLSSIYKNFSMFYHAERKIIDYLKIDVESYEWRVIPQILESGMLDRIRQIGIEFHLPTSKNTTLSDLRALVRIVKSLEDYGMVRFDSKLNPISEGIIYPMIDKHDYSCFEIAWYNSRLMRPSNLYLV